MENEILNIFDEHGKEIGQATRAEVHRVGHWHETFHCWFVAKEASTYYLYFQIRSQTKRDYPSLIDITAAGHILSEERIEDGIREVREEIGINVSFDELISLGTVKDRIVNKGMIDKELAHVFLYKSNVLMEDFQLQKEEVSGIVKMALETFSDLWFDEIDKVEINGIKLNSAGEKVSIKRMVNKDNFVPHEDTYYEHVLRRIGDHILG